MQDAHLEELAADPAQQQGKENSLEERPAEERKISLMSKICVCMLSVCMTTGRPTEKVAVQLLLHSFGMLVLSAQL